MAKDFLNLYKWRNFAKSGQTCLRAGHFFLAVITLHIGNLLLCCWLG